MASRILEIMMAGVGVTTALLSGVTLYIAYRYRREIYRAEKHRAIQILHRSKEASDSALHDAGLVANR